ncbi:protein FAR1-RELATED SEQUENCE 5-like [Beta vulgaris subsp. vulgaris]|uniref:protein FAR1-RELATED SEQUENCE 5-like n=1 Tax=Beta vulgaris subsp. vulgaris TaxID=3555 RepID=UPI0020366B28|nr:protein FAR1-RELATED SEQUENCE 5-like [Beta vulgaris subsp. vulgaris]
MEYSSANNKLYAHIDVLENWIPHIGMEFFGGECLDFCLCAKEGYCCLDKRDNLTNNPRAERRFGCQFCLGISFDKVAGKYRVHDFVSEHNHVLHPQETTHLLSSQRKITEVQAMKIERADDFGIQSRATHEFIGAHVDGTSHLGYTRRDHKNYLRSKRQKDVMYGEVGSLLRYFHLQTMVNPSFQYSVQLDCEEKITNIFWADAKMIIDYASFGDVVAFDTTFGTNKENRPLGVFVGFNHSRKTVVFGADLLYNETI